MIVPLEHLVAPFSALPSYWDNCGTLFAGQGEIVIAYLDLGHLPEHCPTLCLRMTLVLLLWTVILFFWMVYGAIISFSESATLMCSLPAFLLLPLSSLLCLCPHLRSSPNNRPLPLQIHKLTPSNARTAHFKPELPIPTLITINPDRTFSFTFRTPSVSFLLKKAAGIEKGSGAAGSQSVGTVTLKHVYEIAKIKASEDGMKHLGEERIARAIVGSARSMGIEVVP